MTKTTITKATKRDFMDNTKRTQNKKFRAMGKKACAKAKKEA